MRMTCARLAAICGGIALMVGTFGAGSAGAQAPAGEPDGAGEHWTLNPADITWKPAAPGVFVAVISGSPETDGAPFVLRLKLADGTRIPPHWHPVDEHLTVLIGTFHMGVGERFEASTAMAMSAGTYAVMNKEVRHFGWSTGETVLQIHGTGPFKTYFVQQPAQR